MKILLVGEYSRLHNSLKEGLLVLGHEVTLISTGDYFKDFPSDIKIIQKYDRGIWKKIKVGVYKIFREDLTSLSIKKQFFSHKRSLTGFDVVQLINESPFGATPKHEMEMIAYLKEHNKKLFLLSAGADYTSIQYALSDALAYSILEGYKNGTVLKSHYDFALKYTTPAFKKLHDFIFKNVEGVIATDLDYHIPLQGHPKYLGLIPNPVNIDVITPIDLSENKKVTIFLGINRRNYHSKGIHYFEVALQQIEKKYSNRIEIIIAENLPYQAYISSYNKAHIVLDQVLSFDQGYNALEAMAKGKVVFTGAEKEFLEKYGLKADEVCINALPDVKNIVLKLSYLIENPERIKEISMNARRFVEQIHDFKKSAKNYIEVWKGNTN